MPLSEDEHIRLGEIESHIRATDPAFVRRLTNPVSPADLHRRHQRMIITLWCLLFVGVSVLANGVSAAKGIISLGALAAVCGATLTAWTTVHLVRHRAWQ